MDNQPKQNPTLPPPIPTLKLDNNNETLTHINRRQNKTHKKLKSKERCVLQHLTIPTKSRHEDNGKSIEYIDIKFTQK